MAVGQQVGSWSALFAERARGGGGTEIAAIMALANRTDVISFCGGVPDPVTFPGEELVEVLRGIVASGDSTAFQYAPTEGLPSTREWLAGRIEAAEGRRPVEGELVVTSGGIEALELLGKVFLDRGDTAALEAPTYLGAVMGFESFQAGVAGIPMDEDGLDTGALERELAAGLRPKLLYTIADFQNPTGLTLSTGRRHELVALAREHGFLVVEDVAYRELAFPGADQPPSLWSLAPDTVLQVGTFSKTFLPGVRLGWAVGPAEVVERLVWAKQNTDQCAAALGQRLLEEYARRGLLDRQVERSRVLYAHRCRLTMEALERHMPEGVRWTRPGGGFFTWVTVGGAVDTVALADRALEQGVAFVPGVPFYPDGRGRNALRIAFSRVGDEEIDEGFRRVGQLVAQAAGS